MPGKFRTIIFLKERDASDRNKQIISFGNPVYVTSRNRTQLEIGGEDGSTKYVVPYKNIFYMEREEIE